MLSRSTRHERRAALATRKETMLRGLIRSGSSQRKKKSAVRRTLCAEMLEPRMLLSAAGIAYRPTIALPAMASLNQVTDTTASLAVAANDIAGQNALSYTWSTSKRPVRRSCRCSTPMATAPPRTSP